MLCDDVKRVIYFFLDGSLADRKSQDLQKHLSDCPDCETRIHIHRRMRLFIVRRLARESAPARFKQRLTRSLRAISASLT